MNRKQIIGITALLIVTSLLSILPQAKIENITHTGYNYYFDLFQHSFYYLSMTIFVCWLFPLVQPWKIALIMFGLSMVEETAQIFSPKRSFSVHDIFSNLTGATVAMLIVYGVIAFRRRRAGLRTTQVG